MADEVLTVGLEKLQVEETQHSEKLMEEKIILPEKLKCDSFESSNDSGSDSKSESGSENEKEIKGVSRGERKNKQKTLKKKRMKNETKKNEGDKSKFDKLERDSSDTKSGYADSGDETKTESGSAKVGLEEVKQIEKKKGLIEKIREKLSGKSKEETAEVANTDILDMKEGNMKNLVKLRCDSSDSKSGSSSDSGSESSSATKKDTHVVKGASKMEKKNKVLKKKMKKKKATKKNEGEANMANKLQCDDNSDSKSGSGDDSGSDSKSDSGSSSEKDNSKEKRANKESKKELEIEMKEQSIKKQGEEANRTPGTDHDDPIDAKVDTGTAMVNSEIIKIMEEDLDAGKKGTKNEVDEGAAEKKGIFGKILERLPSYYKKGGK